MITPSERKGGQGVQPTSWCTTFQLFSELKIESHFLMDAIYTPTSVAMAMVKSARCRETNPIVADFAVGDGELLRAALARWPKAKSVGNDIRKSVINRLSKRYPSWSLSRGNFLNSTFRDRAAELCEWKGKVSLIFLNPPFSNRGARRWSVFYKGRTVKCTQGLAFVIASMSFLAPQGEIVAVLPAGTMRSQMDSDAWKFIEQLCEYKVLARNGHNTFPGFSPKTIIVRLKIRRKSKNLNPVNGVIQKTRRPIFLTLERGKVDMTKLNGSKYRTSVPLIHTTELKENTVNLKKRSIATPKASLAQEAVLVPRVGRPNRSKICLYIKSRPVALSTCIIAIKCQSQKDAKVVYHKLLRNWPALEDTYGGTCASYVTVGGLRLLLGQFGFQVRDAHK